MISHMIIQHNICHVVTPWPEPMASQGEKTGLSRVDSKATPSL